MVWKLPDPERWIPVGYAVVRADSRGAGRSPGYLDPLLPQEAADFCQAIEWAAAQPWSTGKVGLCGVSYYAMAQWLAAARQPPHLAAIIAWEGAQDFTATSPTTAASCPASSPALVPATRRA